MTPEESQNFIEILKSLWSKLIVCTDDTEGWLKRLWRFDYIKAKNCVQNFKFNRTRQGLPPTGLILQAMQPALLPRETTDGDPVELYVIIRPDGSRTGFPTASSRGVPKDKDRVQRQAEELRKHLAGDREGYYIQWLCEGIAPSVPI